MARMEDGVPGPTLAHVLGPVEVGCDPEAGVATTLRECCGQVEAGRAESVTYVGERQRGRE